MNRKIPTRKCIGCGELKEKNQLVRIVRSKEGEISLDMFNCILRSRNILFSSIILKFIQNCFSPGRTL